MEDFMRKYILETRTWGFPARVGVMPIVLSLLIGVLHLNLACPSVPDEMWVQFLHTRIGTDTQTLL